MRDLDSFLPNEVTSRAIPLEGNGKPIRELVLAYEDAVRAIDIATSHLIAILGLESFEVQKEGLQPLDLTGYDSVILFEGDWKAYVTAMNAEAKRWIQDRRLGEDHGYILTSASKNEFASLKPFNPTQ